MSCIVNRTHPHYFLCSDFFPGSEGGGWHTLPFDILKKGNILSVKLIFSHTFLNFLYESICINNTLKNITVEVT